MDEVMAIVEVSKLLKSEKFDLIILDTAPTGHTLRMLALPKCMERWIRVLDLMQAKHRFIAKRFTGKYQKDSADIFLETMANDIKRVNALLKNPETTEFVPITIPEPLSISETERLVKTLNEYKIPVRTVIVNRVSEEHDCDICLSGKPDQEKFLIEIEEKFGAYNLQRIPLLPKHVRGITNLIKFGQIVFENKKIEFVCSIFPSEFQTPDKQEGSMMDLMEKSPQFLLFGGKGGVGKTSVSAATALLMAQLHPDEKVLLFSTDPAHSLSDSFDQRITENITPVFYSENRSPVKGTNLFAVEIDAMRLFADFKLEYQKSVEEMFSKFIKGGMDLKFDQEVMQELISLSPPGLDEIMALKEIMDLREKGDFDYFILDTAPTGHLLRFLSTPDVIKDWLNTLFGILIKFKGMVRLDRVVDKMLDLARSLRKIREILSDPQKTGFVAVTIPEAMAFLETERLLAELKKLKIPCSHILSNMSIPITNCRFCNSKRQEQRIFVQATQLKFEDYVVKEIPMFRHEIKGIKSLSLISETLYETPQSFLGQTAFK